MTDPTRTGAAVIGTGFIGTVHIEALRRLGIPIRGVLGSSSRTWGGTCGGPRLDRAYASLDELLADPTVHVVHVTSPNVAHFDQVRQILAAGRHVICEKPLAMTSAQSAEMVALARSSGLVAAVCYNTRFYPLNQHAPADGGGGRAWRDAPCHRQLPSGLAGQGHRLELAAGGGQRAACCARSAISARTGLI